MSTEVWYNTNRLDEQNSGALCFHKAAVIPSQFRIVGKAPFASGGLTSPAVRLGNGSAICEGRFAMPKQVYWFPRIDIHFSADPVEDAALIQKYQEYARRASQWDRRKKKLTPQVIKRDGCCVKCGSTENLVADHVVPLRRGGENELNNLQVLCWSCNSRKAAKDRVYGSVQARTVHHGR